MPSGHGAEMRKRMTPDYTIGCKGILPSTKWYPALIQDNVELIATGVEKATATGVIDAHGVEREVDTGRNATLWPDWTFRFHRRTAHFDPDKYSLTDHAAGREKAPA